MRIFSLALLATMMAGAVPCGLPPIHAQQIKVNVKVVNVAASVLDEQGRPVANLTAEDFVLEEDGRPQKVKYFSSASELPLAVGLLVDVSPSQERVLEEERRASAVFLEQMISRNDDKAFVIRFGQDVDLLQGWTSSPRKLKASLLQLNPPGSIRVAPTDRRCGGFSLTALYDAISSGAAQMKKVAQSRRALVVLTNGVDHNSCSSLRSVIEEAQRADTIVYVILFADQAPPPGQRSGEDGTMPMQKIAFLTGGDVFRVSAEHGLSQIYGQIEGELRQLYSLGYSSDLPSTKGEYRRIRVTIKRSGLALSARDGYFAAANHQK